MEARLELKLHQKLIMTPQLQQAIKLLQLSRLELVQSVSQELVENPVLEEMSPETAEEVASEDDTNAPETQDSPPVSTENATQPQGEEELKSDLELGPQWDDYINELSDGRDYGSSEADNQELPSYDQTLTRLPSLSEHLLWQLHLSTSDPELVKGGEWIIGNLDDDGYLRATIDEVAQQSGLPLRDMARALTLIQSFDPMGVGARDLQECLMIQIKQLDLHGTIVEKIIQGHLTDLEKRRYSNIAKVLNVTTQEVLEASQFIINELEPKPGRPFLASDTSYMVPDVYVVKIEDHYTIQLNDEGLPRVRINPYYKKLLHRTEGIDKVTKEYVEERLRSAQWLIKGMEQRNKTIYRVAESIVKFQQDFFDQGITHLKPMVLKNVAEDIGMHESTISRVTTNKFMHTPQGIFPMKYFFTTGFLVGTGTEVSSLTVKDVILKLIKEEDAVTPLKDQQIVDTLKSQGIDIARRTVAKYREELRIPPTSVRKRIG
ncbi:MAG TPA: RNA polymerase factor sigma-54 [Nitrospirota bacterium]|nr:RNA polymerase factor sigma-54 [Nitrospirota bacterium]